MGHRNVIFIFIVEVGFSSSLKKNLLYRSPEDVLLTSWLRSYNQPFIIMNVLIIKSNIVRHSKLWSHSLCQVPFLKLFDQAYSTTIFVVVVIVILFL